jgi:hypothetical protein
MKGLTMARFTALLGTLFYLVWGALHIQAGITVARLGTGLHKSGMVQGRIYQDSWTLFFAAGIVMLVALISNWKGWTTSYWLNLGVASITDVGFIIFIIVPGYAPLWPGLQGPVAWSAAVFFWTWSYLLRKRDTGPSETNVAAARSPSRV